MLSVLSRQFVRLVPSVVARNPIRPAAASRTSDPHHFCFKCSVKSHLHARSFVTTKPIQGRYEFNPKIFHLEVPVGNDQDKELQEFLGSSGVTTDQVYQMLGKILSDKESKSAINNKEKQEFAPTPLQELDPKIMQLSDTIAVRRWLEDEILQAIKKSSVLTDFDLEAIKTRQVDEQKKYLKNLYKQSIHFNPFTAHCDLRFLTSQADDPVYKQFANFATSPDTHSYYLIRAGSGAGKTSTILNAIGRNQYLLYVDCTPSNSINKKDTYDVAYESFLQFVSSFMESNTDSCTPKDLTVNVTVLCQVFWLSKLLVLQYMRKNNKVKSPEEWIFWSTSVGLPLLKEVQESLLVKVSAILKHGVGPYKLKEAFDEILQKELAPVKDSEPSDIRDRIWIAVDEAQLAFKQWETTFQSLNATANDRRSLIYPLVVFGLPLKSRRIIAGIGNLEFTQSDTNDGTANGSTVYSMAESDISFPYVDIRTAWKTVSKFFDMNGLSSVGHLQGRLSYVYQFIAEVSKVAQEMPTQASTFSDKEKQQIFDSAYANLQMNISENVTERFCEVYDRLTPELQSKLLDHAAVLSVSHSTNKTATWSADQFAQEYKVAPEEIGFLFFSKRRANPFSWYEYVYSVPEPYLARVLQIQHNLKKVERDLIAKGIAMK